MKAIFNFVSILFLGLCSNVMGQPDTLGLEQFIGDWQGEGHFYNVNLSGEVGSVRFTLRVSRDMEITGSVGSAEIVDAKIEVDDWNDGYQILAKIQGKIFPGKDFNKDSVILLLKLPSENQIIGDFHLKSNFVFDFSMRPGEITLIRNP